MNPNALFRVGQDTPEVERYREDFEEKRIPIPPCKVVGCLEILSPWGCFHRKAVRGADGSRLKPLPMARFICQIEGHGTTSWLPPFLCRYVHYAAAVVEMAVEEISVKGKKIKDVVELDGPSPETLQRWNEELTSIPVREWILRRLPGRWPNFPKADPGWPERVFTWEAARSLAAQGRFLYLRFFSVLLQRARLALMIRYAADWRLDRG